MTDEATGRMYIRQPQIFTPRKQARTIVWEMSPEEAADVGRAMCEQFPPPDLAYDDGLRLQELAAESLAPLTEDSDDLDG